MEAYDQHLDEMQEKYDQFQEFAAESLEDRSEAEEEGNGEP
jgi:hypothetical protein